MNQKSGLLWFVLVAMSLSSCVSYQKYRMEVFKPAQFSFPESLRKIAIVSRNLKYENDTLQNYHVNNGRLVKDKIRFNTDSLAIKNCFDTLSAKLLTQNRFDSALVVPVQSFAVTRVKEIRPANAGWYNKLADETGADGLIVLDMFSVFYKRNTDVPNANVVTSNIWTFYDVKSQKITDRFTQLDTLYWDGNDESGNFRRIRIPAKKEAISLASGVIGENYSKHILPAWTMVYRDIMTCNNPELMQAANLAQKNKWEEASVIWQKYSGQNNKRNQIVALHNLALASEIKGDIDRAIELTAQAAKLSSGAFRSSENEAVRNYSAVLYRRKIEIEKLNGQNEFR